MATSKPSIPKGTRDFGPVESLKRNYIIETIIRVFKKYGFDEIQTPAMELLDVLMGKYGEEGDQLLFKILNSGDYLKSTTVADYERGSNALLRSIAKKGLRYDLTVPFARFVVQNQNTITFPFKRYQVQPVWRADRPQKGRYQEFYQCDVDIVGTNSLWNEAELTLLIHEVFKNLGLTGFELTINHRDILNNLAKYVGLKGHEMAFCITIDKLDKIGVEKVTEELLNLGATPEKLDKIFALFSTDKRDQELLVMIREFIGDCDGIRDMEEYFDFLEPFKDQLQVVLDPSLARGLTYYTGIIFEVKSTEVKMGSITGGGRYDNLTSVFGLSGVSGVGISFGLDRIYDVLEELDRYPPGLIQSKDLMIAHFDNTSFRHGVTLVQQLREQGITAILYPEPAKIKKQFNYADKLNIRYTLVIGSEEMKEKKYTLKDMSSGDQSKVTISELVRLFTH